MPSPHHPARIALAALLLLIGMSGPELAAQNTERPSPRPPRNPTEALASGVRRAAQGITPPADPGKVMGTYELDGRTVELTEGEFYATYELLKPHLERPNQPLRKERVLEHVLLFAEAQAMGFAPSEEEAKALNPLVRANPMVRDQLRQRWQAMGITEESATEYQRQITAIERMKLLLSNSVRTLSNQAYELWKTDNQMFRIRYAEFPAERYAKELAAAKPDQQKLMEFWKSNNQVQSKFRLPTAVSAQLFVFDPETITAEQIERARAARGGKVPAAEALGYFAEHRERLMRQVPSGKRHLLYPNEPPALEKLVSPFELLRPQIEREILLGDRIGLAHKAVLDMIEAGKKVPGNAVAKLHGLEYILLANVSREEIGKRHARLGFGLFTDLFRTEPGKASPTVQHHQGLQYFWVLNDRQISQLPSFEQAMKNGLVEEWVAIESFNRARADAQKLLSAMQDAARADQSAEETAIDQRWKQRLDAALAKERDPNRRRAFENQYRAKAQAEKNQLALSARAKHFEPSVKALGLELREHGPFVFALRNLDRTKLTDPQEKVATFLETNYAIKAIAPGQVTSILSDAVSRTHFIVRLEGKEDPPFGQMSAIEYHKRSQQIERQASYANTYDWTYARVRLRRKWMERF